jgi:hypothetical protein
VELAQLERNACAGLAAHQQDLFGKISPSGTFQQVAELPGFADALGDMHATSSNALAMHEALLGWPSNVWCAWAAAQPAQLPNRHGAERSAAKQPCAPSQAHNCKPAN